MRPSYRGGVNKKRSAKRFRGHSSRTNKMNMKSVMRGGIRF